MPATNSDVMVTQTQDDELIGLDTVSGDQYWIYEDTVPVPILRGIDTPLTIGNMALVGPANDRVVAVDVQRGLPIWEQRVVIPQECSELDHVVGIDGGLLPPGDALYVVSYQGRVVAPDMSSGRLFQQREASSYVGAAEDFGSIYISQAGGSVEGLDSHGASSPWNNDALARRQLSVPAVLSSNAVVGDLEGCMCLLSQMDGRFVDREQANSDGMRVRPLVVGGWMYMSSNGGRFVAYTIR